MKSRLIVSVVVAAGILAWATTARAEGWRRLGQAYVDYHHNPVAVSLDSRAGTFSRIKLQVKENALEIRDIKVFTGRGDSFDVPVNKYLGAGKATKAIDVPGGPKAIEKVEVNYHDVSNDRMLPLVRILGES